MLLCEKNILLNLCNLEENVLFDHLVNVVAAAAAAVVLLLFCCCFVVDVDVMSEVR